MTYLRLLIKNVVVITLVHVLRVIGVTYIGRKQ